MVWTYARVACLVRVQNHVEGMDDARHIAQQGEYEIEPKLASQTDCTKHA